MQEPTHILAGVVIQRCFDGAKHRKMALGLTAAVAFLSHGFLDNLARVTYHPANPDFHSPVWVGFHAGVLILTILFLWLWWKKFKWGILFACLPDVDWIFIHGQEMFHFRIPFYRTPHLHHLLGFIYDKIPPFSFATHYIKLLPYNRHNPWAGLWEALLIVLMLLVLQLVSMARRPVARSEQLQKA
jgi:hypothetical protein